MASDLERVAQGLVECLDQVPAVVAHLQRTAQRCRDNAAFAAQLGAQQPALYLDAAARACEQAAHVAAQAAPKAREWADRAVRDASTKHPTTSRERSPFPDCHRRAVDGEPKTTEDTASDIELDLSDIDLGRRDRNSGAAQVPDHDLSSTKPGDRPLLKAPPADTTIRVDKKFTYRTDGSGRVIEARADLDLIDLDHPRDKSAQRKLVGKLPGDHAGHIFARIFGGPLGNLNLLPMAGKTVNLSMYKTLENHWRRMIESGNAVNVFVAFRYPEGSRRPDTIWVEYEDGDELVTRRISNDSISPKGTP
ncbi:DNA/RNA non-specific endonuclease [Kribbella sp. NPDC059898]|uniref:DNA/RNA non-specific endonuclease n=1 Tax=Kribbella sp. NPDC059898 TaxID=3346995 RepID=UPI00364F8B24